MVYVMYTDSAYLQHAADILSLAKEITPNTALGVILSDIQTHLLIKIQSYWTVSVSISYDGVYTARAFSSDGKYDLPISSLTTILSEIRTHL